MRNAIAIVFAAIITLTAPGRVAQAQSAPNCSQVCTANGDFGVSHGQCASLCQTCNCLDSGGNTCPACECKVLELMGALPPDTPLGQCISVFTANGTCFGNIAGLGCEF